MSLCNLYKSRSHSQVNIVKNRMWHPNVNSAANGHIGLILDILDWNQSWTQKGKHWNWWYWLNYWKLPQVMKKQSGWSQAREGQESITGKTMRKWYDLLGLLWGWGDFIGSGSSKTVKTELYKSTGITASRWYASAHQPSCSYIHVSPDSWNLCCENFEGIY